MSTKKSVSSDFEARLTSADRALKFLEKIKQLALEEKAHMEMNQT